jgi:hypothetical protein
MRKWVYIATPEGASLGRTFRLALGAGSGEDRPFDVGLVRREIREGVPHLRELRSGDELRLMYDLFFTGIVYPVGVFRIEVPKWERNPRVEPVDGYPAIGSMQSHLSRLEPDYVRAGRTETVLVGSFSLPDLKQRRRVYLRTDTEEFHALHPEDESWPLTEIGEEARLARLEERLLPHSDCADRACDELRGQHRWFALLDGRAKQLLVESRLAEGALGMNAHSLALAALPLSLACEYEVHRLLTTAARERLRVGDQLRIREGTSDPELSWIPDPNANEKVNFGGAIRALKRVGKTGFGIDGRDFDDLTGNLCNMNAWRNRLAHAYFIGRRRYRDVQCLAYSIMSVTAGTRLRQRPQVGNSRQ